MDYLMTTRRYVQSSDSFSNDFSGNLSYVKFNSSGTVDVRTGEIHARPWIEDVLSQTTSNEILVYVHGYNTTHTFARQRLNQIRRNTVNFGFPGVVIGLDWPSKGKQRPRTYRKKRKMALDTGHKFFVDGLLKIKQVRPDIKIHLMAHSMGAFMLTYAIQRHAHKLGTNVIDQVMFIAPDVERSVFEGGSLLSAAIDKYANRLTCYYSEDDRVLQTAPGVTHFPGARSGLNGMRNITVDSFEDVACHNQHRVFVKGRKPPPDWQYSHRWHFDDKVFIRDTVDVLAGKTKANIGVRKKAKHGDQHLA